jgi:hypothetical protein
LNFSNGWEAVIRSATVDAKRRLPARLIGLGVRRERITSQARAIPQAANQNRSSMGSNRQ